MRLVAVVLILGMIASPVVAAEAVEVARGEAPQHPQQPQMAIDSDGTVHLVYGVGDTICYANCRTPAGAEALQFSPPVELPAVHEMSLGMRRGPRIAVVGTTICVTAIGGKQGKGRDGDVLALRSIDGGKTWSEPVRVNDVADSAREGLHAMASDGRSRLCCVWLDLRNRRTEIIAATSTDGGESWTKNELVYRSPDGSICECCHPSVAYDPSGRALVLWRNSLAGNRDMYLALSDDGGRSFGPATKIGTGSWPLKACPMDGGAIATAKNGAWTTAWRRDKTIYLHASGDAKERALGEGEQPWLAATQAGSFVIWVRKRGDAVLLLRPGEDEPILLDQHAADPVIAAGPSGQSPVVAAWESRDGVRHTIRCQLLGHPHNR